MGSEICIRDRNYIGHGDPNTWAGEKIIQKSDLPLLHPQQDKLAIWVAGTCSFGNYFNPNSLMENILINKNISIVIFHFRRKPSV